MMEKTTKLRNTLTVDLGNKFGVNKTTISRKIK